MFRFCACSRAELPAEVQFSESPTLVLSNPVQILEDRSDVSGEPVLERRPIAEIHRVFGKIIGHVRPKTPDLQRGQPLGLIAFCNSATEVPAFLACSTRVVRSSI